MTALPSGLAVTQSGVQPSQLRFKSQAEGRPEKGADVSRREILAVMTPERDSQVGQVGLWLFTLLQSASFFVAL